MLVWQRATAEQAAAGGLVSELPDPLSLAYLRLGARVQAPSLPNKTKTDARKDIRFVCERAVKRCVNVGKNSKKVCNFTRLPARQIGIYISE